MKPEHAQEIYETIGCLSALAIQNFNEAQTEVVKKVVSRAKQLLGLERPDVPEPGTIVEVGVKNEHGFWIKPAYVECFTGEEIRVISEVFETADPFYSKHPYTNFYKYWRYPGETDFRRCF